MHIPRQLSLYVHIPFCSVICPFCDFTKYRANASLYDQYVNACLNELRTYTTKQSLLLRSVFLGGGTPSLLPKAQIKQLMNGIQALCDCSELEEVTIEMNPEDVTEGYLDVLAACGITRLSLGAQSLDQEELTWLGRGHTAQQVHDALRLIKNYPFIVSVDLMFGLPNRSVSSLKNSCEGLLSYDPEHISCYSLTIEPGTPFYKRAVKKASQDEDYIYFEYLNTTLNRKGYDHYEISSYAQPGYECIHNTNYWNFNDYVGIGVGAHSLIFPYRFQQTSSLSEYMNHPEPLWKKRGVSPLEKKELIQENIIANLRYKKGISFDVYLARYDINFQEVYHYQIQHLCEKQWITVSDDRLCVTEQGLYLLDDVCLLFL